MARSYRVNAPFEGLRTDRDAAQIGPKDASDCLNLVFDRGGCLQKRAGFTSSYTQGTGEILGIERYRSQTRIVFKTGQSFYKVASGDANPVLLGAGGEGASGTRFQARELDGRLFIADGSAPPHAYNGTTLSDLPITAPATAPTLAAGSATGQTGTYEYVYSYYSSTWGYESARSAVSTALAVSNQKVTVTLVASADSRVDKMRVYRRKTSILQSEFHLVEEIAQGTSYTDDENDSAVFAGNLAPDAAFTLPAFTMVEVHKGRLFWAGDASNPDRLYMSEAGQPGTVTKWVRVLGDEAITAVVSFRGRLCVFKRRQLIVGSGEDLEALCYEKRADVGCFSPSAWCIAENALYFWGEAGIYRWDGEGIVEISAPIAPTVVSRVKSRDAWVVAGWDEITRAVMFSYTATGSTNNRILLHFPHNLPEAGYSWLIWDLAAAALCQDTTGALGTAPVLAVGRYNGKVGTYSGTTDDGVAITSPYWTTGKIDADQAAENKHWCALEVVGTKVASATIAVSYILDDGSASTPVTTTMTSRTVARQHVGRRGRTIRVKLAPSAGETILGFHLGYEYSGRAS